MRSLAYTILHDSTHDTIPTIPVIPGPEIQLRSIFLVVIKQFTYSLVFFFAFGCGRSVMYSLLFVAVRILSSFGPDSHAGPRKRNKLIISQGVCC
jgi:heme O synthase-like polyprenyltransferase